MFAVRFEPEILLAIAAENHPMAAPGLASGAPREGFAALRRVFLLSAYVKKAERSGCYTVRSRKANSLV